MQIISNTNLQTVELMLTDAKNDSIICLNARNNAERALLSYLNMSKDIQIKTKMPKNAPVDFIPVNEALLYAKENHPSFVEQKQKIVEAKQHVDKTSKERFMDAEINISVGFNQIADNFSEAYCKPLKSSRRKTKQFSSYFRFPTSHTTVRAVRHTAVPILGSI